MSSGEERLVAAGFEVAAAPRPDHLFWRRPGVDELLIGCLSASLFVSLFGVVPCAASITALDSS
jgi:hypothetical protein